MRVGVDLLWLRPGVVGGSEEYLSRLLAAMADLAAAGDDALGPDGLELTVFALPAYAQAHPEVAGRWRTVPGPAAAARPGVRLVAESLWLPPKAAGAGVQLMHHGGGTLPFVRSRPAVLTLHDLQYLTFPHHFSTAKLAWLQAAVPRAVRRARVTTVPSEYVRQRVLAEFGVHPATVVVVPHGVGAPSTGPPGPVGPVEPLPPAERDPVFVYPAITYPHKDHVTVVRALARVRERHREARLVLLGGEGPAEAEVRSEVERLGLRDAVLRPGRVPAAERDGWYRRATALVFPSRYEGFGAPVVEAMLAGLPVIAAATTALPEVVGDAGLLVAPQDEAAWADAMSQLLERPDDAARLARAGLVRAARFAPDHSARALVGAYRLALDV